jgi:hypothetical protein
LRRAKQRHLYNVANYTVYGEFCGFVDGRLFLVNILDYHISNCNCQCC